MKSLKLALLSATVLMGVGAFASVNAADMYTRGSMKDAPVYTPVFSWTGFYLGVHGGGAWGDDTVTVTGTGIAPMTWDLEDTAFMGGVQLGYNFQSGSLVLGIESDLGYMGLDSSGWDKTNSAFACLDTGFYGTLTGRVGVAVDRALIYAKGGAAFIDTNVCAKTIGDIEFGGGQDGSSSDTMTGWVLGGGVEYALSNNWTLKAEYLHFDMGTQTVSLPASTMWPALNVEHDITIDTAKVGINYKFGETYEPLK